MPTTRPVAAVLVFGLCAAGCSPDAFDAEGLSAPEGAGRRQGQGQGMGTPMQIIGGDIAIMPRSAGAGAPPGEALGLSGRHVLFLNFEGVDVRGGDSALDNAGIRGKSKTDPIVTIDPYLPGDANRYKSILQIQKLVAGFYSDMNVDVVISRPLSNDYLMTIVGGHEADIGLSPPIVGISPGDCRHANENHLNFDFSASLGYNVNNTAITAAHEAGHAFGLGHTANNMDIMFPSVSPAMGFLDQDMGLTDPGVCNLNPARDKQNSYRVLLDNLGPRDPARYRPGESAPPVVKFLAPVDLADAAEGTMVGNNLTIAVKASAKLGLDHLSISASRIEPGKDARSPAVSRGGHPLVELRPPSSAVKVRFSAAGDYLLVAAAYDLAGNVSLSQSKIKVAAPTCGGPSECTPGQRCSAGLCITPPLPEGKLTPEQLRAPGTACERSDDCQSGICALTAIGQICTGYCNAHTTCAGNLECVDSICMPQLRLPPKPLFANLGGTCTRNEDCGLGLECSAPAADTPMAPRYCTKLCDPEISLSCPGGMLCQLSDGASGMKTRCIKGEVAPAKGGCSAARSGPDPGPGALCLGLLALLLMRLRRTARRGA